MTFLAPYRHFSGGVKLVLWTSACSFSAMIRQIDKETLFSWWLKTELIFIKHVLPMQSYNMIMKLSSASLVLYCILHNRPLIT